MARRSSRRVAALLTGLALVAAACSTQAADSPVTTTVTSTTAGSEATTTMVTTTRPDETGHSTTIGSTTTLPGSGLIGADVGIPVGEGPFDAVVLVHGGGWIVGDPSSMAPLAAYLNEAGYLTVNASYRLSLQAPGFPGAMTDISCAVAFAANHPQSTGEVTLLGHSAGAHIAAVVALDASTYDDDCEVADAGLPSRFIGLAGPYDIDRVGPVLFPFFGVDQEADPELWASGNPFTLIGLNPDIEVLLIHGEADQLVPPDFSEDFAGELGLAGVSVDLELLPGVDHAGARSASVVGELIVEWLQP